MVVERDSRGRRAAAETFLWIVQAAVLSAAASARRANVGRDRGKASDYSGTAVFMHMDEAIRAAGLIPETMSPVTAAAQFCQFRAEAETSRTVPGWFVRVGQETQDYTAVSKHEQFLWLVQTAVLADAENQAHADPRGMNPRLYDAAGIASIMSKAAELAGRVPDNLDAPDAASDFFAYYVPGMREMRSPPKWCRDLTPQSD